jgi:hypothetical protein
VFHVATGKRWSTSSALSRDSAAVPLQKCKVWRQLVLEARLRQEDCQRGRRTATPCRRARSRGGR